MFAALFTLSSLLFGVRGFMIHNAKYSLCLEDSAATGEALLQKCNLDSEFQQWIWINQDMLMCAATSRCLSAMQRELLQTQSCEGPQVDAAGLMWDCDRDRLISRNTSMLLSVDGRRPILTHDSKHAKWRSLDDGNICQNKLRSKRGSNDLDEFEAAEEPQGQLAAMTEEQKAYLRWFYRTEDPTTWKFVLLGAAFICLLVGFMLLGMGAMANKSRKEIAKYKAAAAVGQKSEGEELLVITPVREDGSSKAPPSNGEVSELKAGSVMVTWKDGNTSCLYADPAAEEEKQEETSAAELEADEEMKTME